MAAPGLSAERLSRAMHDHPGMPRGIKSVIQDVDGYLWIASEQGLDRFDGSEVRPWGRALVRSRLEWLAAGPGGQVAAAHESQPAWEVAGETLRAVMGPDGAPIPSVRQVAYDRSGRLWLVTGDKVMARDSGGGWIAGAGDLPGGERARWLGGSEMTDGVFASSREGSLYRIAPPAPARRIASLPGGHFTVMHVLGADSLLAAFRFGPQAGLYRIDGSEMRLLLPIADGARPTGVVHRGRVTWLVMDEHVFAIDQEGRVEELDSSDGFEGGGTPYVDREGSLWLTSFRGELRQYLEPDTRWWTVRSGLEDSRARNVMPTQDGIWAGTWSGPFIFEPGARAWRRVDTGRYAILDPGCTDPAGAVWAGAFRKIADGTWEDSLARYRDGAWRILFRTPRPFGGDVECAATATGGFALVFGDRLVEIDTARGEIVRAIPIPRKDSDAVYLQLDPLPMVMLMDGRVCKAQARPAAEGDWRCDAVVNGGVRDAMRLDNGTLWLATEKEGVLSWDGRSVTTALSPEQLGFTTVARLAPSPSGNIWVVGEFARVLAAPEASGARVVETIGESSGVFSWSGSGLLEEPDGTVWIATLAGMVQVAAHARRVARAAPDVQVTRLLVDGSMVDHRADLEIPYASNRIELSWSARSYQVPGSLRYRYRLSEQEEWVPAGEPRLRFAGLGPGHYRLELAASVDGDVWSAAPAVVRFEVMAPWYRRWWAVALAAGGIVLIGLAAHRIRVRRLMALERQRAEIAMDLHDRMGSGLASIGLMADMVATPEIDETERAAMAEKLVGSARRLGGDISDIVWSLRPGLDTLEAFVLFLRTRSRELIDDRATALRFDVPDPIPRVELSLPVRRHVQWMAVEALHNAAKHARAAHVDIMLRPDGARWLLEIRDDGVGFQPEREPRGSGFGQDSLRRRAREIGASLRIESPPGGGTLVAILFDPQGGSHHGPMAGRT